MIYWFTGQPGHGKTTLADALATRIGEGRQVFRIDGDDLRAITANTDYSRQGREANVRSAQNIALYLFNKGFDVIVSLVSPYRQQREEFKSRAEVLEIYVHCDCNRGKDQYRVEYERPESGSRHIDIDTTSSEPSACIDALLILDTRDK